MGRKNGNKTAGQRKRPNASGPAPTLLEAAGATSSLPPFMTAAGMPPPSEAAAALFAASLLRPGETAERLQIRNLIKRVGMINRIHTALRYTLNVDDIYSVILTTVISAPGLDFSRAMLFAWDETRGVFRGQAALGATTREQHEHFQREIAAEEDRLAAMVRDFTEEAARPAAGCPAADHSNEGNPPDGNPPDGGPDDETLFGRSLRELSSHSFWITTYQKYSGQNDLLSAIQPIELPGPAREGELAAPGAFLEGILASDTARLVHRRQLLKGELPHALTDLLPADSLWAAIRTQKGARLLLIADKIFQDESITQIDLLHMDWLISQVALALENAEMFQDLESAYHSLRELDRLKSNFLATVSHELRTPLTAINGYVQLLLGGRIGAISPGQNEVLGRIHAHSDLLTGKVNDLIEIAEMDAGRGAETILDVVDPLNTLMNVLPRVESRRAHKGTAIEPQVTSPIPRILASPDALGRILFHLLDNAIKFGHPQGHVWVGFHQAGEDLKISIADDGIGISENQLQRIFDVFYQVDNQLTRSYEGLGIGLAVIKRQLEVSGGRIEVESRPGQGSTFTVIYPLANPESGARLPGRDEPGRRAS